MRIGVGASRSVWPGSAEKETPRERATVAQSQRRSRVMRRMDIMIHNRWHQQDDPNMSHGRGQRATPSDPLARRGCSCSASSTDCYGWRYQEPAGSPTRRRAQTWHDLFIAPCALREAPAGFSLDRLATAFMNHPGWPASFMSVSAAIADSRLRPACRRAGSPLGRSTSCSRMPPFLTAPRARLAARFRNFATNRHE